jgi:hypothetical protein
MLKRADYSDLQSIQTESVFVRLGYAKWNYWQFYFYEHDIFPLYAILEIKLK